MEHFDSIILNNKRKEINNHIPYKKLKSIAFTLRGYRNAGLLSEEQYSQILRLLLTRHVEEQVAISMNASISEKILKVFQ